MTNRKKLSIEFLLVIFGRVILAISGILLLSVLLAILDAREYSLYVFLFSTASWLSAAIFAAANIPLLNFISNKEATSQLPENTVEVVTQSISLSSFPVAVIISTACSIFVLLAIDNQDIPPSFFLCVSIGFLSASIGAVGFISTFLMGKRLRIANTLVTSGFIIVRVLFLVVIALLFTRTADYAITAATLAAVVGFIFAIIIAYKKFTTPNLSLTKRILKQTNLVRSYWNNWPIAVGNNVFVMGDKVYLAFFLPIEAIGLIAIYQQFCRMLANVTSDAVFQFIAPMLLNNSNANKVKHQFLLTSVFSFTIYVICAIPSYFILLEVNKYLLQSKFTITHTEYILVAATVALNGSSRITELNFFKKNIVSQLHIPMALSIISFLILGYFLSSYYGIIGGLTAILLSAIVRLVSTTYIQVAYKFNTAER